MKGAPSIIPKDCSLGSAAGTFHRGSSDRRFDPGRVSEHFSACFFFAIVYASFTAPYLLR